MRICVFGAGAIGGLMAARLARTDADVSVVARGAHLEAIRGHGLTLVGTDGVRDTVAVAAAENPSDLGPQDVVILTLKAHQIPAAVPAIRVLLGEGTAIVHAVNGIPWWYFHRHGGPLNGKRLAAVDPGDAQWSGLGPARMIGCVVYPAAEVVQPGVVRHIDGVRFSVGEPSGDQTDRVSAVSRALTEAGFRAPVRPRIRDEIWLHRRSPKSWASGSRSMWIGGLPARKRSGRTARPCCRTWITAGPWRSTPWSPWCRNSGD